MLVYGTRTVQGAIQNVTNADYCERFMLLVSMHLVRIKSNASFFEPVLAQYCPLV